MRLFQQIKAFNIFRKGIKKREPVFGDNPATYGVKDPAEEEELNSGKIKETRVSTFFPEEGGSFTRIEGEKEPFPGIPSKDIVMDIGTLKRMVPAAIDAYYPFLQKHLLKPERYCKSVREVYRLFNIMIERETQPKHIERWKKVRDIVCIILEFDNAYRFRFQDIVAEANIEELKLDKGDRYWAGKGQNYKWGFLKK